MTSKQDIISNIYFDRSGFGSRAQTLTDAKKKDASITKEDVEEFFKSNIEEKRKMRGRNSYIPPHSFFEFQFDLFFINDIPDQKFKAGALMIDVFSKYMVVVPVKSTKEGDVASGLIECLNKMGGKPKLLYTDDEPALSSNSIQQYLKEENIQHHRTSGHANFAERGIRSFKDQYINGLKQMKRREKLTYNGRIIYLRFCLHIITKIFILLLNSRHPKQNSRKMNLKLN